MLSRAETLNVLKAHHLKMIFCAKNTHESKIMITRYAIAYTAIMQRDSN